MSKHVLPALVVVLVGGGVLTVASSVGRAEQQSGGRSEAAAQAASLPDATAVKAFIASQVARGFTPPKTPWGAPDISGNFTTKDEANTPFERPKQWAGRRIEDITPAELAADMVERQRRAVESAPFAGGGEPEEGIAIAVPIHWFSNLNAVNSRPWFVIDPPQGEVPPLTASAQAEEQARAAARAGRPRNLAGGGRDSYTDRSLGDRCISGSVWRTASIYGNSFHIVQSPDYVVFRYEGHRAQRIIALNRREHLTSGIRLPYGDSVGWFEGNTLVVETTHFEERMDYQGHSAKNQRLIERFTRTAPDRVEWTVTIDDPTVWSRPWTYSLPMTENDTEIIYEYACHEGNYAIPNLLTAGRTLETRKGTQ